MSKHKTIQQLRKVTFQEGRLVYLGNIPYGASKHELEVFVESQGFPRSTFYWGDLGHLKPASSEHDGRCVIEFTSEVQAQDALSKLSNVLFKANHLYTDKLELTEPAQPQSLAQRPPPVSASPSRLSLKENIGTSSDVDQHHIDPAPSNLNLTLTVQPPSRVTNIQSLSTSPPSSSTDAVNSGDGSTAAPSLPREAIKVDPIEMRKALDKGGYPEAFKYSENWGRDDIRRAIMALDENEGRGDRWVTCNDGVKRIRSECLAPDDINANTTKITTLMERIDMGKKQIKPTDPLTDRDVRFCEKLNDTFTASAPYQDTVKFFAHEIQLSRKVDKMDWEEGQMLGEPDSHTKAPISTSQEFLPPGDCVDNRTSTFRGHQIRHLRPSGAAAGFGSFDQFRHWEAHGRPVNKAWVPPSRVSDSLGKLFLAFVDDTDDSNVTPKVELVKKDATTFAREKTNAESWQTLYEKLNKLERPLSTTNTHRGPRRGSRGRVHRGGRGSHRGGHRGGLGW
ncbi:hypothetical protein FSARC_13397 [Fusarium sarcochroum]|uniref:RRM domain-containing protein n=1 Tax=Fusarium sarcochroum TaxID=1208366 RepID=A0A8H4T1W1_9HYPO|nr:hypothetical protein FSARC_13397 [Fusarium sarcochroum]